MLKVKRYWKESITFLQYTHLSISDPGTDILHVPTTGQNCLKQIKQTSVISETKAFTISFWSGFHLCGKVIGFASTTLHYWHTALHWKTFYFKRCHYNFSNFNIQHNALCQVFMVNDGSQKNLTNKKLWD